MIHATQSYILYDSIYRTFLGKAKLTVKKTRTVAGLEEKDMQELARRGHEGISWTWKSSVSERGVVYTVCMQLSKPIELYTQDLYISLNISCISINYDILWIKKKCQSEVVIIEMIDRNHSDTKMEVVKLGWEKWRVWREEWDLGLYMTGT